MLRLILRTWNSSVPSSMVPPRFLSARQFGMISQTSQPHDLGPGISQEILMRLSTTLRSREERIELKVHFAPLGTSYQVVTSLIFNTLETSYRGEGLEDHKRPGPLWYTVD